ncbi:NAD(P)-binding protein [Massarina eburnea CBS 473.64]|uniref:NAD(P)-binding protein n=1 Tax=Massarina eburnea CBS 473.64 TaxID=1395130 RepID=A0A6A6RXK7_9PLEO|nr:NAD(P)-binding protein [Massarina eburnea CBS 473.64]
MSRRRILVTGADNLVGSHILRRLLSYDVSIRAVVDSAEEVQRLRQQYPPASYPRLDFTVVSHQDLLRPDAFQESLQDQQEPFDTIVHTVTADPADEADCLARFIGLETESLTNFLRTVKSAATKVQRVVFATSLSPFARWLVDPLVGSPHGSTPTHSRAASIDSEYVLATCQASDNIVHDALRKWMRDVRARFDLVYLTAPSVYGPSIRPLQNSSDLQEANRRIWNICSNDSSERMTSPPYGIDYFADVRDLAFASVESAFAPQAGNKRFVVSAGTMPSGALIADFLIHRFPELRGRVRPEGSPPRRTQRGDAPLDFVDTHLAATVLGLTQYRRVEDTLSDLAQQILELHRRKEWKRVIQS